MKQKAFTLTEMLMAALVASILLVVMAPVMTRRAKEPPPQIEVRQGTSVPVGSIVLWYGQNIPEGWIECQGQDLNSSELSELKEAIGQQENTLPDLNPQIDGKSSKLKWIIKTQKN